MKRLALAFLLLAVMARSATAGPVTIVIAGETGQSVTIYAPGTLAAGGIATTAGAFLITGGDLGSFDAYCVDLKHYISVPGTFGANPALMSSWSAGPLAGPDSGAAGGALAAWLFNTYSASASTAADQAALQLAIWEVLYDTTDKDVKTGPGFYATGNTATLNAANALLAGLPSSYSGDAAWLQVLDTHTNYTQDVMGGPVPDGGMTLLLLGGALVGLGALRRTFSV